MTAHDHSAWQHTHQFHRPDEGARRRTTWVMWLTLATMGLEIVAGGWFNSMALLADGWHMSSHALALGLSVATYRLAERHAADARYAFGTWKVEVLGGYTSALLLVGVAGWMAWSSVERLLHPEAIDYPQALAVAALGLLVNLGSAWLLGGGHNRDHGHGHGHGHAHAHEHEHEHEHEPCPAGQASAHGAGHAHHDLNLRAAYLHVLADAATSVAAMLALVAGWWLGWAWMDPVMGLVGAVLVAVWAKGLLAQTSAALLDREMDHPVVAEIREVIAEHGGATHTTLADLHVWRVARGQYACALSLVTHAPSLTPDEVRRWLSVHEELVHCTIEIQRCDQPLQAGAGLSP